MASSIVVIRHGNTELNTSRVFQPYETPLSKDGLAQAELCGTWLANYLASSSSSSDGKQRQVSAILTSDLTRTRQTTELVSRGLNSSSASAIRVIESPILRERDFGDLKGQPYQAAPKELFEVEGSSLAMLDYVPPNGESVSVFNERVEQAWAWVLQQAVEVDNGDGGVVVVVTHGLVKKHMSLMWAQGKELGQNKAFDNTSISIVSSQPPHQVELFGSTQHLPPLVKL